MPRTDRDGLSPDFGARLRAELDRVRPLSTEPRYAAARQPIGVWRLAPAALAFAFIGILGLMAWAATGSANPAVWTQRVETVINPPSPSPTPESSSSQQQQAPQVGPPAAPTHKATALPTHRAEPTSSPEPRESPEPGDNHSGGGEHGGSSFGWPSPSPRPSPSPWHSPSPSPQDH